MTGESQLWRRRSAMDCSAISGRRRRRRRKTFHDSVCIRILSNECKLCNSSLCNFLHPSFKLEFQILPLALWSLTSTVCEPPLIGAVTSCKECGKYQCDLPLLVILLLHTAGINSRIKPQWFLPFVRLTIAACMTKISL
jgi:hypothetical protein